jgi:DNA-binding transcriptional regulator GbsR (MarR family)
MTTEKRIKKQRELVEEMGRYFDKEGFQPIAGRILALLMVMDKEQYTFDEITEELQISKSSASNALRNLEIRESIEYITLPGDRKRYFRLKTHNKYSLIEDFEKKMIEAIKLFNHIIELKADPNSKNTSFLKDVNEMIELVLKNIDKYKNSFDKE